MTTSRTPAPVGAPAPQPNDRGAALVLTLFAMTLVMVLGTTLLGSTIGDLRAARSSRDAAGALDAADAGLAQAVAYLRTSGVGQLGCAPGCASGYGSSAQPTTVTTRAGSRYRVWVEPISPLPTYNPGTYRVHSTGTSGTGVRSIVADVVVGTQPIGLPLGIFARSVTGGGTATVTRESLYTTGCVYSRSKIVMAGTDVALGIPAAVHSAQYVSDSHGSNADCGVSTKAIHRAGPCASGYGYDHDVQGGSLSGTSCGGAATAYPQYYGSRDLDGNGTIDVNGSYIRDAAALRRLFGIPTTPFTDAQLDTLRAVAQAQGTYFLSSAYDHSPDPAVTPHAVMFFDLAAGGHAGELVDLKSVSGWSRAAGLSASSASCPDRSLLIVVDGGDVRLNGNQQMAANIVLTSAAPYGHVFKANGTAALIGTIYADSVDLTGTVDVSLDECFVKHLSPSLVDTTISVTRYREVDRS